MKFRHIIYLVIVFVFGTGQVFSQKAYIQDLGFRETIKSDYPQCLDASDSLIISEANRIVGSFNFHRRLVKNISGIEYFINLDGVSGYSNELTTVLELLNLRKLRVILLFENKIETLPDLDFPNLISLHLAINNLKLLPSLHKLYNLEKLYINENQLTILPPFVYMTNLSFLECGENQITELPEINSGANFKYLYCYQNKLTKLPSLNENRNLKVLHVDANFIESLPDLSSYDSLEMVKIRDNKLTFEDLIPNAVHPKFDSIFKYSPQKPIGKKDTLQITEFGNLSIKLNIDLFIKSNTYKWYRNGTLVKTTSTGNFEISTVALGDSGIYTCEVSNSNPKLKQLVLKSLPVLVRIKKCLNVTGLETKSTASKCNDGGEIDVVYKSIDGGKAPYRFELKGANSKVNYKSTSGNFENLIPDIYSLYVFDNQNCSFVVPEKTSVPQDLSNCTGIILTPNGDGKNDEYFFTETGQLKIYDSNGNLFRKINAPILWDGKNENGAVIPDYYIIKNEKGETFHITIIY